MIAVGCDWARKNHCFVVLAPDGTELARFSIPHSADGFSEIVRRLSAMEPDPHQVRIAVEGHDGPLIDWFEDQDYTVIPVNPKSSHAARTLLRASGSKDDELDAYALARIVLMDAPQISPRSGTQGDRETLTMLLRQRERRVQEKGDLLRRLKQLLQIWAPKLAELCHDLDRIWTRRLLKRFQVDTDLREASAAILQTFARKNRLCAKTRERLFQARKAETLPVRSAKIPALRRDVSYLLGCLETVTLELQSLETDIEALVAADPDVEIVRSLPRAGTVCQAAYLVAFSTSPPDTSSWTSVAARSGVAPVTKASGASRTVNCRRACDSMLKRLLTYHAFQAIRVEGSWAQQDYSTKRECGTHHYTALRSIAKRWVKIVHAMLRDKTHYSEDTHQQARKRHLPKAA